ncbi:hypothetical protein I317_03922 [Kwoniella heveanensis CBS 569]|nr:hypothetical protein I317_03922 [Kwoniella heveanensis CBS 569]
MSFTPPPSLPPISTLSSVLDSSSNGSMMIAPELMGEEGLPPSIKRKAEDDENGEAPSTGTDANKTNSSSNNNNNNTSSGSKGYQSSSARDEPASGARWGNGETFTEEGDGHSHPWEGGYRDEHRSQSQGPGPSHEHGHAEGQKDENEDNADKPKPKKRARVSKPRQSKDRNGGPKDDGIPEEGVFDYADPSGDFKLGPVFVHPPKGAAQACVRCHKIKRKCDNARPRCAGCSKADVACVFELSPATESYVTGLKSDNIALTSQIASAAERIQQLESVITNMERGLPPNEADLYPNLSDRASGNDDSSLLAAFAAISKSVLSVRSNELANPVLSPVSSNSLAASSRQPGNTGGQTAFAAPLTPGEQQNPAPLPPYDLALQAVETFFVCNAISYPFLDRDEFLRDMDEIYRRESNNSRRGSLHNGGHDQEAELWAGKEFLFFMVLAIGTTNRERLGEVEKGSSMVFRRRAMYGLHIAVSREDILAVQSLILLGIYAMFDPSGTSLWHVVGFAARIAIALNLHRRVDDPTAPAAVVEHRKRVFYSLYNLDRLVSVTLSKPLAISDNDIDVELPSPLPSDEPFRGRPRIEFTQHIIKLRRLSGIILSTVYSVSGEQNALPETERASIIRDLHSRLDAWLAECPVPPEAEQEKPGMITNHSWFLLNYHQGLCLLYRPSPLFPNMTADKLSALYEASSKSVDLYIDLWRDHKVSYNLINVSMQFLACISLLYCLCEYDNREREFVSDGDWRRLVTDRVSQCQELLEAFSRALPETAKYREIYSKLSELLLARHGPALAENANANALPTPETAESAVPSALEAVGFAKNTDVNSSADGQQQQQTEGEAAWNAMTQLWFNSGDFAFDERALAAYVLAQGQALNEKGAHGGQDANGSSENQIVTGRSGSSQGLWNQLG